MNGEEHIAPEAPGRETEIAHRPSRRSPWASQLHGESVCPYVWATWLTRLLAGDASCE